MKLSPENLLCVHTRTDRVYITRRRYIFIYFSPRVSRAAANLYVYVHIYAYKSNVHIHILFIY
jgi:hypothetical protein